MKRKIRLKGHETFILREGWMTKGMTAIAGEKSGLNSKIEDESKFDAGSETVEYQNGNPWVFSENYGSDILGVGSNMAKAIRYWMRESQIIKELPKQGAKLTDIGRIVYDKDQYIENMNTLWLLHVNLVLNVDKVTSWYVFFNLLESMEFTREELQEELKESILTYSEAESIPDRSVSDDVNAILNMYCREHIQEYDPEDKKISPFIRLGLMKKTMNRYMKIQPSLDHLDNKIVLYILCRYARKHNVDSISIDDIVMKPELVGKVCNLGRVAINQYLDELANEDGVSVKDEGENESIIGKKLITVNRTAGLDMVYLDRVFSDEEVVAMFY